MRNKKKSKKFKAIKKQYWKHNLDLWEMGEERTARRIFAANAMGKKRTQDTKEEMV